jgi:hypothetical protein
MPDRILRDEILSSERYWSVSLEAQQLFIHIILIVDDASRCSGNNFTLRSKCFQGRPVNPDRLEKLLGELIDADLVRAYQAGYQGGIDFGTERYLFLPRSRQRKRYLASSKYPAPPKEISDLAEEESASSQPGVRPKSVSGQTQDERRGVEEGLNKMGIDTEFDTFWKAYPRKQNKAKAKTAFAKLRPDTGTLQAILEDLTRRKSDPDWLKENGTFVPHPSSYLNNRRWEDEASTPGASNLFAGAK